MKSNANNYEKYGSLFTGGDVVGYGKRFWTYFRRCLLDLDAGSISFYKNGTSLGVAFSDVKPSLHYYPTICIKNCSVVVRFAAQSSLRPFPAEASPVPSPSASKSGISTKRNIMALILEPTRELAQQTYLQNNRGDR